MFALERGTQFTYHRLLRTPGGVKILAKNVSNRRINPLQSKNFVVYFTCDNFHDIGSTVHEHPAL
jgi:hypothetical protein